MQFRDLKRQYEYLKENIDFGIKEVLEGSNFIQGWQVQDLEKQLSEYVGVKHCLSCANGTDALQLAMMVWGIKEGDAVFVPDFTFFSSGEIVSAVGAIPIFVDIEQDTFNISVDSLEKMIQKVLKKGAYIPRAIVAVDLFGQPANHPKIREIAKKYNLYILEDGAQGFGGGIGEKRACSFGDISTTSFFPAKPLGCYGDGGAVFTDNDEWAELLNSYRVHGKGSSKYDNLRIGMNSRLDTLQAAILRTKISVFANEELPREQKIANLYSEELKDFVKIPYVEEGYYSSWAQYTIQLPNKKIRDGLQESLKENNIPSMIYYNKPMHKQEAFKTKIYEDSDYMNTNKLCDTVLSLPFHPYLYDDEVLEICKVIKQYL